MPSVPGTRETAHSNNSSEDISLLSQFDGREPESLPFNNDLEDHHSNATWRPHAQRPTRWSFKHRIVSGIILIGTAVGMIALWPVYQHFGYVQPRLSLPALDWSGPECPTELTMLMVDPSFWDISRAPRNIWLISPRLEENAVKLVDIRACMINSVFSARLVADELAYIVPLEDPVSSDNPRATEYTIVLPTYPFPSSTYTLEVTLEFGYLRGGPWGMPCGPDRDDCPIPDLKLMGDQSEFIGAIIPPSDPNDVVYIHTEGRLDSQNTKSSSLLNLRGYWDQHNFQPIDLVTGELVAQFRSSDIQLEKPVQWVHFVGDSNTRMLYYHLVQRFSYLVQTTYSTEAKPTPMSMVAYPHSPPDGPYMVFTFQWWFQYAAEGNVASLVSVVNTTLLQFLEQGALSSKPGRYTFDGEATMTPMRTYVSFGSHAPHITTLGTTKYLETLFGDDAITPSLLSTANIAFVTTTHVNSSNIPIPFQARVRYNAMITQRNAVLCNWPSAQGRIVDVEAVSRGLARDWMRPEKHDAIHFNDWVYGAWTDLLMTDLTLISDGNVDTK